MTQSTNPNVQFDGKCAFALSVGKTDVAGDNNVTLTKDGKQYFFSNPVAKFLFRILPGTSEKSKVSWNAAQ